MDHSSCQTHHRVRGAQTTTSSGTALPVTSPNPRENRWHDAIGWPHHGAAAGVVPGFARWPGPTRKDGDVSA
jgi:hypothetical protein